MPKVDNAIIMAAGTSSRFAPLSFERPKALIRVKGEVLIERQIRQLLEAGVPEIWVVTGYKAEQFDYLRNAFGVKLVHNPDYLTRNNNASIWAARDLLRNSYLCSADNYFARSPFENRVDGSYYAAVYAAGETGEWCMQEDAQGDISAVTVGGRDAWIMMGHTFWTEDFSRSFLHILEEEYERPETAGKLWESIFIAHLDSLKMKIRRYPSDMIFEFDTLDELRSFDGSYWADSRSRLLKDAAAQLGAAESELTEIRSLPGKDTSAAGFRFLCRGKPYRYEYAGAVLAPEGNGGIMIAADVPPLQNRKNQTKESL